MNIYKLLMQKIKPLLALLICKKVIHTFIYSCLDYCKYWLLCNWFHVHFRSKYKVLIDVCKALHGQASGFVSDLISFHHINKLTFDENTYWWQCKILMHTSTLVFPPKLFIWSFTGSKFLVGLLLLNLLSLVPMSNVDFIGADSAHCLRMILIRNVPTRQNHTQLLRRECAGIDQDIWRKHQHWIILQSCVWTDSSFIYLNTIKLNNIKLKLSLLSQFYLLMFLFVFCYSAPYKAFQ